MAIKSMFYELSLEDDKSEANFTLDPKDLTLDNGRVIPSIYRLYLETNDPSEVAFADKYFGSWQEWTKTRKLVALAPYFDSLRSEVILRQKAQAYAVLLEMAQNGSLDANKFILNSDYGTEGTPTTAPSKAVLARAKEQALRGRGRPSNTPEPVIDNTDLEDKKLLRDLQTITAKVN